ncbi:MAG: hypothetical protein KDA57_23745, partial [Planctomycetales bacterium]|nr:hypothetical protein [Planctomycetales bacterium]
ENCHPWCEESEDIAGALRSRPERNGGATDCGRYQEDERERDNFRGSDSLQEFCSRKKTQRATVGDAKSEAYPAR